MRNLGLGCGSGNKEGVKAPAAETPRIHSNLPPGQSPSTCGYADFSKPVQPYRITNAISQHPGLYTVNKCRGCSGPGKFENNRFTSAIQLSLLELTIPDCQGQRQLGNASTELGPLLWSHPTAQRGLVSGSNSGADWAAAESLKETVSSGAPEC